MTLVSRGWFVKCNARNCDSQCDLNDAADGEDVEADAIAQGWIVVTRTQSGITVTEHYCPKAHRIVRSRRPRTGAIA